MQAVNSESAFTSSTLLRPQISPQYSLFLLTAIYTCHSVARSIPSVVMEPIKKEFHVSDKVMGMVPLAYSLAFILAVLPVGVLIDRMNRVRLLAVLLTVWSAMTAIAGLIISMPTLILVRMGVGAAEAGAQPIALSLLSDIYPQHKRASALGTFYLSTGIGAIIAYFFGAMIASAYGWRTTFMVAGGPGLILMVILMATMPEPQRGAMDSPAVFPTNEARRPLSEAIAFVSRSPGAALILFGTLFSSTVMGSFLVWAPAFLMRQHGLDLKTAGMVTAFAGGVMPACGALVFGFAADRLGRSKAERVGLMCTIASVAMFAAGLSFALAPSTPIAFVSLILFGLFGGSWMAPSLTLLIGLTPSSIRGSVLSFGQIFTAIGAGAGPFLVGWMSDAFGSLAPALACCACVALGAVVLYLLAVRAAAETKVIRQV